MRTLLVLLFAMFTGGLLGQIGFRQLQTSATKDFRSGAVIVSIDMNGDTEDDLVRLNNGTRIQVDLQHSHGQYFMTYQKNISNNPEWNIVAGDLNNDGWPDIVTSGIIDEVKVLMAVPFSSDFQISTVEDQLFFAQASNLADANRDGYLDIFVCNDDGLNRLYLNDGNGSFVRNDTLIDFHTVPASDNSGNYGSTWTDFDMDGDLDLYIAKCRIGAFEPTDPRRINVLYVNTDTGYVEMADTFGLATGEQSWSADFGDIDNDGDLDIIIINHDAASHLFDNLGNGQYVDIATEAGIDIVGVTIQSIFRDFDNDGLIDLLVSGSVSKLYRNLGDNKFEEVTSPFGGANVTSFTIGDLNNDGFPDVYATYNALYNSPSDTKDDIIWINVGTDNNYIRVKAIATNGSSSAVGAKLFLYGPWGVQVREIRAGESYGIGTTPIQNFGLGSVDKADSLVIIWPNGNRQSHTDIPVNTTVTVVENGCLRQVESLDQGPFVQCGSDTFNIKAPDGYDAYVWSNGMGSQSIDVYEPGIYHVTMFEFDGCMTVTTSVSVIENAESGDGEIVNEGGSVVCFGETVILSAPEGLSYLWNTGETSPTIEVLETGTYGVTVMRSCYEAVPEPVFIEVHNPNLLEVVNDTILGPGQGMLSALGDSVYWYEHLDDLSPVASGNSYITPFVDTTTEYYVEQSLIVEGNSYAIGMKEHLGGSKYSGDEFNLGLIFDAISAFRLDSVMISTDFSGKRAIILLDSLGEELDRRTVQLDSGAHWVYLEFDIPTGSEFMLTTDVDTNLAVFGVNSPKLVRSEEFVEYPYTVENIASITGTTAGAQFYYYFYNWQITQAMQVCVGEKRPVLVVVQDTSTAVRFLTESKFQVYPNPTSDMITIKLSNSLDVVEDITYLVRSIDGRIIRSGEWRPGLQISMQDLSDGMYNIELVGKGIQGSVRIVVVGE